MPSECNLRSLFRISIHSSSPPPTHTHTCLGTTCVYFVLLQFQISFKIVSNTLFSKVVNAVPNHLKQYQDVFSRELLFKIVSEAPNRFKYCQNVCVSNLVLFFYALQFQIVTHRVRMHVLETLLYIVFSEPTIRSKKCKDTRSILFLNLSLVPKQHLKQRYNVREILDPPVATI